MTEQRIEPHKDEYASAMAGEPMEDLSRIGGQQPYRGAGPRIARSDLDDMLRGSTTATLREAGLTDRRRRSQAGEQVARVVRGARDALRVDALAGHTITSFEAFLGVPVSVLVAGDPIGQAQPTDADDARTVTLDMVPATAVAARIASWVGLAPSWPFALEPQLLPAELFTARFADENIAPPDDAGAHLREVWAQPWVQWRVSTRAGAKLAYLTAGSRGTFAIRTDGAQVAVLSRPTSIVWRDLLSVVDESMRRSG